MRAMKGFTLIELLIALVILAIISLGIGSFLRFGADGYVSTVERERLQSEARFVTERLSREIRHAAPNSVAVKDGCLSFFPIYLSSFYLQQPTASSHSIGFIPRQQDVSMWTAEADGQPAIKNLGVAVGLMNPAQYQEVLLPRAERAMIANGQGTLTYKHSLTTQSPGKRLYLVGKQVAFCFDGVSLTRQVQGSDAYVISKKLTQFAAVSEGAALNSNGLVHLEMTFTDPRSGERAHYNHSVQVINVQ
ncbi:PilW family protein [Photobacterium sp. GSS17]|uniref:PilW family protein n=1 Tax=Photobacterium TaxID=657 RepID=UPI00235E6A60|nr:prepilin-type N-terminal cleavage/methylation domain-containing protein [Photobacterium sp. GSS17]